MTAATAPTTPGAPEAAPAPAEATPPTTPAPAPTTDAAPSGQPAEPGNVWDDPAKAQAEIERLRRENGAARTTAKQQAADEARQELAQQLAAILDPSKAAQPVDPAKLTEQLTASQAQAKQAALELAVFRATPNSADATALLDSRAFLEKVANIDPTDSTALAAAIGEAITSNPRLKATQAAAVGGAQITGGAGAVRTYTREQLRDPAFFAEHKTDILRAGAEGRIRE